METLIINVPEEKSDLVKTLLTELGVTFHREAQSEKLRKENLIQVSVWSEDELAEIQKAGKGFNDIKPSKW